MIKLIALLSLLSSLTATFYTWITDEKNQNDIVILQQKQEKKNG